MQQMSFNFSQELKVFYAVSPQKSELDLMREFQPPNILLSYALWGLNNDKSVREFIEEVGYKPECIILDSGAPSFQTGEIDTGVAEILELYAEDGIEGVGMQVMADLNCYFDVCEDGLEDTYTVFHRYVDYLCGCRGLVDYVINFDTIGDPELSDAAFQILTEIGMEPMPVFGYGQNLKDIQKLIDQGYDYIFLGGSRDRTPIEKRHWVNKILVMYPGVKFHLLGCQSLNVFQNTPGLYSADGSKWYKNATFEKDRQARIAKARKNIERLESLREMYI